MCFRRDELVVCDHDNSEAFLLVQLGYQFDDASTGALIEVPGWFISEQDFGTGDE